MRYAALADVFEATVLLSTAAALVLGACRARSFFSRPPRVSLSPSPPRRLSTLVLHPLAQLVLVCLLLYANQVLFGAFIVRAHAGDTTFIARYIPGAWFAIATRDPLVVFASHHVGDGRWLSPSLLRVQAFLELPFTIFAYLSVARLLGRGLYAVLCRPVVLGLVAVSFSVTFSLVELSLPNPYTSQDLALRAASCLLVPVYIALVSRAELRRAPLERRGPSGVLGLLAFLAGAAAISYVVLALYDALLLYNLAHLPRYAPGIALALAVAALASFASSRIDDVLARARRPSVGIDVCVSALRVFTFLFFVPSLSLRYWGGHATAVACGLLVVVLGTAGGASGALARARAADPGWGVAGLVRLVVAGGAALAAGGWAAEVAFVTAGHLPMPELLLARLALSFLAVAIVTFRAVEIALCWATHEPKAEADEA